MGYYPLALGLLKWELPADDPLRAVHWPDGLPKSVIRKSFKKDDHVTY
ncbi:hypothetical protein [Sphingobacterium luzhongxinii]|nr:hypothetical protein [Sphingobacterium sp. xlx-73]